MTGNRAAAYAGLVLLVQVAVSLPRLGVPFVEGRAHWTNDDAAMTLRALHSLDRSIESPWKVFGLARYSYDAAGRETGLVEYAHHPVLAAALFRAFARVFGFSEWVSRTFSLAFSLGSTVLLVALLYPFIGAEAAGLCALLYALLPLFYNYQDAWKHETVATFLVLLNFMLALRLDDRRTSRIALAATFFLLFQAEWGVYAIGAGLWLWLWTTRPKRDRSYLTRLAATGAASALINVWILCKLGFDADAARRQALYRMSAGLEGVSAGAWLSRQLGFLDLNFAWPNALALAGLLGWSAWRSSRDYWKRPLPAFGLMTTAAALAWVVCFRNLSWVHHYHQWYLGLGYVLLLAAALERMRKSRAALALLVPLLAASAYGARRLEAMIHDGDFASAADVAAIRDWKGRLIVPSDGSAGPRDWWISPNVALYADPHYKAWLLGGDRAAIRGGWTPLEDVRAVEPAADLVVTLHDRAAAAKAAGGLRRLGVARLAFAFQSPRFAFWRPVVTGDGDDASAGRPSPSPRSARPRRAR